MSSIDGIGNLNGSGVRPLRATAKARDAETMAVQRFSIETLKSGGSMDLGSVLAPETAGEAQTIRQRYQGKGPALSARQAQSSNLSEEDKIEKLSKLRKSAIEYEAFFVDHLVKQMRQSPLAKTPGGDTFSDIAEQPFRNFLSQAGGFGLADTIMGQVARQEGLAETLAANPSIMGPNWKPKISPNLMKKEAGGLTIAPGKTAEVKEKK